MIMVHNENLGDIPSPNKSVRETGEGFRGRLSAFEITSQTRLTRSMVYDLADPTTGLVSATFPEFAEPDACKAVMERINRQEAVRYDGAAAETLSAFGNWPAWQPRYTGIEQHWPDSAGSWRAYFARVGRWDADRRDLFEDIFGGDPIDHIADLISATTGRPIERAFHPRFGRKMSVGLIRKGSPLPHFDFAKYDVGLAAAGHIGVVLVLDAGPGAIQRVWNRQPEPDEFGNYGTEDFLLDPRLTPFLDVPTPVGSLNLLCARYVHEVLDLPQRCTLAAHIAWIPDGDRWVIYA